jgi:hypothetical protein
MKTKIALKDGGAVFNFTCSCGKISNLSVWGMVYRRTAKGEIISPRKHTKNILKCKCGRRYIFVTLPHVMYKLLRKKKLSGASRKDSKC